MSKYSGKCDFYDLVFMINEDKPDYLKNTDIYFGNPLDKASCQKIEVTNEYEAAPLFPHLVGVATHINGRNTLFLSDKPYYDEMDSSRIDWIVKDVEKAIRSLKRAKQTVTKEAIKEKVYASEDEKTMGNIINAVLAQRKPNVYFNSTNSLFRKAHYEKLVELGYPQSVAYLITHYQKPENHES